ncbi:MAG TPA: tetratricopeptide repeat protein [Gemmataceae bacterium]|nr:tetratricopeptide repeat protein [Gemmataceae bacterium]
MPTVFVSSTTRDLGPYREAVLLVCRELGLAAIGMEDFEAMGLGATAGSLAKLDQANVYLGLFAHRYGFIEPGHDRSVTECEFDYAGQRSLERLCFVVDGKYPWPPDDIEFDQRARLDAFKRRIAGLIINWFTDVPDLRHKVHKALVAWKQRFEEELLRRTSAAAVKGVEPPRQLPRPPADFVGRDDVFARLNGQVAGGVAISGIHGLGGIGKTVLALKLAERLGERYPDGHIYLDLKGVDPRPLIWQEAMAHVLHAFHPEERLPAGDAELAGRYRSVLSGRRVLLLWDNAAGREQVEPLLPPGGDAVVLVTSRRRFHLPGLAACDLDALPPADAVALLRAIAPRLDESLASALAERCGYLPLALRLAGATLAERDDLSPQRYLQRLQAARLAELDGVAASLRLSEELLPEPLRVRWRELVVLVGDFEAGWAAAVWGVDEATADGYLGALRCGSLLGWDGAARLYRLHDLVREYAGERLDGTARAEAERRHARYFCTLIADADDLFEKGGDATAEALCIFDRAWPNAQAGFACVRDRMEEDEEAARLCRDYVNRTSYIRDLRQHPRNRVVWLETSAETARRLGDRRGEGNALGNLGIAYLDLGQPQRAIDFYQQQLVITREIGDRRGEGAALGNLGLAYAALGQPQRAIEFHEQYLAIAREVGDRRGEGTALGNLGLAYAALGQPQRAIEFHEQQLVITREIGDRRGEAIACWNLGDELVRQDRLADAIPLMEICVRFEQEIGHPDADKDAARVEELRQRLAGG